MDLLGFIAQSAEATPVVWVFAHVALRGHSKEICLFVVFVGAVGTLLRQLIPRPCCLSQVPLESKSSLVYS